MSALDTLNVEQKRAIAFASFFFFSTSASASAPAAVAVVGVVADEAAVGAAAGAEGVGDAVETDGGEVGREGVVELAGDPLGCAAAGGRACGGLGGGPTGVSGVPSSCAPISSVV